MLEKLTERQHKDRKVRLRLLSSPFCFHRSQSTDIVSNTRGSVTRGENADRGSAFTITTTPPPIRRSRKPGSTCRAAEHITATGPPQAQLQAECTRGLKLNALRATLVFKWYKQTNKETNKQRNISENLVVVFKYQILHNKIKLHFLPLN